MNSSFIMYFLGISIASVGLFLGCEALNNLDAPLVRPLDSRYVLEGRVVEGPVAISSSLAVVVIEVVSGERKSRHGGITSLADGYKKGDKVQLKLTQIYNHFGHYSDVKYIERKIE